MLYLVNPKDKNTYENIIINFSNNIIFYSDEYLFFRNIDDLLNYCIHNKLRYFVKNINNIGKNRLIQNLKEEYPELVLIILDNELIMVEILQSH